MTDKINGNSRTLPRVAGAVFIVASTAVMSGQGIDPLGYSVATPRPISPADGTTTPSAQATQRQNPYLGSVPSKNTGTKIELSLRGAIERGLRYNLGLVEANQASADVRAERMRALSAQLPQLSADARQGYENLSYKEIGLKLPPISGLPALPSTSGAFGYQDARVSLAQSLYNAELRNEYRARRSDEQASMLSVRDSRDVVVFAVGTAYLQVIASAARVETTKAQLASAGELDQQTADQVRNECEAQIEAANIAPQQVSDARAKADSATGHLEQARADLDTAQLNLSYTKIYAPVSGVIGRKTVELGHRVQPGQSLLVIVPLDDIWITANFKETQLRHMRPGQPVTVRVDTFGRDYKGKVENLPGAAGPLFSLFPPENATGNYVKVVQRFPVRIRLDKDQDPERMLRPGMSVEPTVVVH